jgi:hypothetical protein
MNKPRMDKLPWEAQDYIRYLELKIDAYSELEMKRVYDWLMKEGREPARTKFTSGWKRNLAKEIEFRIKNR